MFTVLSDLGYDAASPRFNKTSCGSENIPETSKEPGKQISKSATLHCESKVLLAGASKVEPEKAWTSHVDQHV